MGEIRSERECWKLSLAVVHYDVRDGLMAAPFVKSLIFDSQAADAVMISRSVSHEYVHS